MRAPHTKPEPGWSTSKGRGKALTPLDRGESADKDAGKSSGPSGPSASAHGTASPAFPGTLEPRTPFAPASLPLSVPSITFMSNRSQNVVSPTLLRDNN